MLSRILVGVDGHAGGRDALTFAEAIAPPNAEIELVHVQGDGPALGADADARREAWRRGHARAVLERARDAAHRAVTQHVARSSSAARGLHERAEETGADLIVTGNAHPSGVARLIGGDTARALLRGAPCAVALVPPGTRMPDPVRLRVAVGYDARPEAAAALDLARDVARRSEVPVRVVTAIVPPRPFVVEDAYTFDFDRVIERESARARAGIDALGAGVEGRVEVGGPAAVLTAVAERSDVLVVGSRGYGPLRRLVLGSTSEAVVAHAACTVVVVPRVAREHRGDPVAPRTEEAAAT